MQEAGDVRAAAQDVGSRRIAESDPALTIHQDGFPSPGRRNETKAVPVKNQERGPVRAAFLI